jgi:hypothetical protein
MDHQHVSESIACQLTQVWAIHRTPAFVEYIRQTYGGEPRKPVRFAGIFSLQMIGGYFFPDLPAGPGPVVEGLWLTDDTGFRASTMDEMLSAENPAPPKGRERRMPSSLESDNELVVHNPAHACDEPISAQPCLFVYPKYLFCVRGDGLFYIENFGYCAWCKKVAKLVVSNRLQIQDARITTRMWQGRLVGTESNADQTGAADGGHDPGH